MISSIITPTKESTGNNLSYDYDTFDGITAISPLMECATTNDLHNACLSLTAISPFPTTTIPLMECAVLIRLLIIPFSCAVNV
jgi:hypothetical protein